MYESWIRAAAQRVRGRELDTPSQKIVLMREIAKLPNSPMLLGQGSHGVEVHWKPQFQPWAEQRFGRAKANLLIRNFEAFACGRI